MSEIILSRQVNEHVPKVRWIASLSNGETIFEDRIPGQSAAWKRLGEYVKKNNLAITKVRVDINELRVDLPSHKDGYIQKKKIASLGANMSKSVCIGYVENGRAMLHQLGEDRSSVTSYIEDPGAPWTIYRHDISCYNNCCTEFIKEGLVFESKESLFKVKKREGDFIFASKVFSDGKVGKGRPKKFTIKEVVDSCVRSLNV